MHADSDGERVGGRPSKPEHHARRRHLDEPARLARAGGCHVTQAHGGHREEAGELPRPAGVLSWGRGVRFRGRRGNCFDAAFGVTCDGFRLFVLYRVRLFLVQVVALLVDVIPMCIQSGRVV